jgi:lipoprotein-releasing system ATP-binding protein
MFGLKFKKMLEAKGIRKSFGTLNVLKGIDLTIEKGELVSIMGASGAGKSTLLHILGTLDTPDEGSLNLEGEDLISMRGKALAKFRNGKIGFIFQFHNLLPEFTALENICIPGYLSRSNNGQVEKKADEIMERLGISDRKTHKPSELSGGEQQRVAVARAMINEPAIIFADEPSGNLDSQNASELHKLFVSLRDELEQTFVIVTHNDELANLADRKLVIKDGLIL